MIIHGDCYKSLFDISDSSVDLVLIDPPYQVSRTSGFKKASKDTSPEMVTKYNISIDFGEWDKQELDWNLLFTQFKRVLKDGGTLIIFYDIWKSNQIKEYAEKNKFKQPRVCAWIKTNPVPVNSKLNYLSNATEYFFTFVNGSNPTFNSEYDKGFYHYPICHGKERHEHPTQKPLGLINDIVKKHTNLGDKVLDCFAGTGTTGVACKELERDFILIEKEEKYFNIIQKRLNKQKQIN
jgi:site-specific DNA-methyltransferase (adenine-specific)